MGSKIIPASKEAMMKSIEIVHPPPELEVELKKESESSKNEREALGCKETEWTPYMNALKGRPRDERVNLLGYGREIQLEINPMSTFCHICGQSGIAIMIWTQDDSCEVCKSCIVNMFNEKTGSS